MLYEIAFAAEENGDSSWEIIEFFKIFGLWGVAFVVFLCSFLVAGLVSKLVANRIASKAKYDIHEEVLILLERSVYFTIVILGAVIAFRIVGIDLSSIIGFLGLGIGFAFKDLLANFIAGVVILTQKKFKIGDLIKVGGRIGTITEIDVRTTDVKSLDGTLLVIPNSDMLTNVVQNFTANAFRRISLKVGVEYATPLDKAIDVATKAVYKVEKVVKEPATQVMAMEFSDSSIDLEVRFWVDSQMNWVQIQSEVIQNIRRDFDNAEIKIPFPIRTLEVKQAKTEEEKAKKVDQVNNVFGPVGQ